VDEIPDLTQGVFGATARVALVDGSVHEHRVECIEDFPVREKLDIGASEIKSPGAIQAIVDAIAALESYGDIRQFTALL